MTWQITKKESLTDERRNCSCGYLERILRNHNIGSTWTFSNRRSARICRTYCLNVMRWIKYTLETSQVTSIVCYESNEKWDIYSHMTRILIDFTRFLLNDNWYCCSALSSSTKTSKDSPQEHRDEFYHVTDSVRLRCIFRVLSTCCVDCRMRHVDKICE